MSDPELGKTAYNKRLESIRRQLGTIYEAVNEIDENEDMTRLERINLIKNCMSSIIEANEDLMALEAFGRIFKQTGALDPKVLDRRR